MTERERVCVCVKRCRLAQLINLGTQYTHTHTEHACVRACVRACVCVRERERERERERDTAVPKACKGVKKPVEM